MSFSGDIKRFNKKTEKKLNKVFNLKNNSKISKMLKEKQFLLTKDIVAIALEQKELAPNKTTKLFVVYYD